MSWEKLEVPGDKEWKEFLKDFEKETGFSYTRSPRYFVDENLGEGPTNLIRNLKANVTDVWEQNLVGKGDELIWRYCQRDKRILLSHDDDFMNEHKYPIKKSYGCVVFPHKSGGQQPLVKKMRHLISIMKLGAGLIYEKKITIRENSHWEICAIGDTGVLEKNLYDVSDVNHVFKLIKS